MNKKGQKNNNAHEKKQTLNNLITSKQNNLLFQEINEILAEQEGIKKRIINQNKNYLELELSIPESLTQSSYPIKFLLKLTMNYPNEEPELYCITKFSYPHIYDGRNLIDEVLKSKWNSDTYNLDIIINRIPKFIIEFTSSIEDGYLPSVGKYILNKIYPTNMIKHFPIFIKNVKENHLEKNKIIKINKILTISDLSFCLYEKESKNFSKLTFQKDLNNLITIKRNTEFNTITFIWKNKNNDKENIEVEITTEDTEEIKTVLLKKMELFGKEYNVNQKIIKKRMGKLPCTDIEKVEKQIKIIEKEFEDKKKINMESVNRLMSLYQKSVEYYSAINSPQFMVYTDKIKELMKTQEINDLIDKSQESNISTEDSNIIKAPQKKEKKEKEEKIIIQGLNKIKNKLNSISGKKEQKKTNMPKVALSKEDDDGGTLDVGPDDEEEEEEDDGDDNEEEKQEINKEEKKDESLTNENKEEINSIENKTKNKAKEKNVEDKLEENKQNQ